MSKFKLFFLLLLSMILLSSCSPKLSGKYEGLSTLGLPISFEFNGDKVTTDVIGYAITGTYKLNGSLITMSFTVLGQPQEIEAEYKNDKIYFDNVVLEKRSNNSIYARSDTTNTTEASKITNDTPNTTEASKTTNASINSGKEVNFQDYSLEKCIRKQLNLPDESKITDSMCEEITFIKFDSNEYDYNDIKTLVDLNLFPNISELYITQATGPFHSDSLDLSPLSNCPKITTLSLVYCRLLNIEAITNLPMLSTLYIDNNTFTDYGDGLKLKGINKCPELKSLTLKNCIFSDDIERLGEIINLEYLDISSPYKNGIEDYSPLGKLSNLKYLDMHWSGYNAYNPFDTKDASFINNLTNLEELNIYETGIENYSLSNLYKLKKLTISKCNANEVLNQLSESGALKNLEYISIHVDVFDSHNGITQEVLKTLSNATNLSGLNIDLPNDISYDGFEKLVALKKLTLNTSELNEDLCNKIGMLTGLEELRIKGRIDDFNLFLNLTNLKKLYLDEFGADFSVSSLKNSQNLSEIELRGLDPSYPIQVNIDEIGELKSLKTLYVYAIKFKSSSPLDDLDIQVVEKTLQEINQENNDFYK